MAESVARGAARPIAIVRRPIYSMFLPVAVVCFVGALITDLAYKCSGGTLLWLNFSAWLLTVGLAFALIALIVLLIDSLRGAATWLSVGLLVAVWVLEFINSLVHSRDGWTAVVPAGLILSVVGALLILLCGWVGQGSRYYAQRGRA